MSASLNPSALARLLGQWSLGNAPAYRELADVVRLLILDGRVALDTALPSERAFSAALGVSRTTVTAAYGHLREQGFLSSGQGSRGRTRIPRLMPSGTSMLTGHGSAGGRGPISAEASSLPGHKASHLTASGLQAQGFAAPGLAAPEGLIDLAYASLPASGEVVHRAFAAALTELPALLPGFGYDAIGLLPLREAVASRYTAAGVPTTADQILVTSGAQHALNIIIRSLAGRQDKVLVEHPSYPNALDAIRAAGCRAIPVAFTAGPGTGTINAGSGGPDALVWDVQAAMMQQRPKMAYMVPDFHNPTGQLMPDLQRRQLVRAAAASGTVLVVDETLRDLNLDGAGTSHVAAFSPAVVTIGSLSKSHWAGLRTGWIRASKAMIQRFAAARSSLDLGGPAMEQLAAAHLVRALDEPLPARLAHLRESRAVLLELLAGHLPEWETARPAGGLSVWCRLPAPISTALTVIAPDFGIRLAAGPRFGIGGAFERYLRVPFTLPPEQLETAVRALRSAQDRLDAAPQLRSTLKKAPAVAIA